VADAPESSWIHPDTVHGFKQMAGGAHELTDHSALVAQLALRKNEVLVHTLQDMVELGRIDPTDDRARREHARGRAARRPDVERCFAEEPLRHADVELAVHANVARVAPFDRRIDADPPARREPDRLDAPGVAAGQANGRPDLEITDAPEL